MRLHMWKRKNPARITTPKMQNATLTPITPNFESSLNGLTDNLRKDYGD
jgi:hypothetical protein